jgi:uncharacterized protein
MSFLESIRGNGIEVIVSLVLANFTAQIFKTIYYSLKNKKIHLSMLINTGSMPSSHSSTVVAMASSIAMIEGFDSVSFAIAFCLAAVVMYDSAGVRRSAGRQAEMLNSIVQELFSDGHHLAGDKLKELIGHSPKEVLAGAALGLLVSLSIRFYLTNV